MHAGQHGAQKRHSPNQTATLSELFLSILKQRNAENRRNQAARPLDTPPSTTLSEENGARGNPPTPSGSLPFPLLTVHAPVRYKRIACLLLLLRPHGPAKHADPADSSPTTTIICAIAKLERRKKRPQALQKSRLRLLNAPKSTLTGPNTSKTLPPMPKLPRNMASKRR